MPDTVAEVRPDRTPVVDQIFGHNRALLDEVLKADFADVQKAIDGLVAEAATLPTKVNNDDDQAKIGRWIVKARAYAKRSDELRQEENKPVLAAQRGINAFFGALAGQIDTPLKDLQKAADDYVRRKEAEARAQAHREAE